MTDTSHLPDDDEVPASGTRLEARLPEGLAGRLDRALADALPQVSRARLRALMEAGVVTREGVPVRDPSAKPAAGGYRVEVPAPSAALPEPQDIPLEVLFEDSSLIVINKPAGMAAHPGPGIPDGTLVNALLYHCGASLSGIGGVARPGIVHRLDKETSGVMVAAKTDAAHQGLAGLFAAHDIERIYMALVRGAPRPTGGEIRTRIGRSSFDRMKMAVLKSGGREAVTHYRTERVFGPAAAPLAARVTCRLETGRTHQIRVHMASLGSPCLGDPDRRMMGPSQSDWLRRGLANSVKSGRTWQVLGNEVVMARVNVPDLRAALGPDKFAAATTGLGPDGVKRIDRMAGISKLGLPYGLDMWDGYPADRQRLYGLISRAKANAVVVSGDSHAFWANELYDAPEGGNRVAVEFGTTAITSPGAGDVLPGVPVGQVMADTNREVVYSDQAAKGFVLLTLGRTNGKAEMMVVSTIQEKTFTTSVLKTFTFTPGTDGVSGLKEA